MSALRYSDEFAEILDHGEYAIVHDKRRDAYYRLASNQLPTSVQVQMVPTGTRVSMVWAFGVVWSGVALLVANGCYSLIGKSVQTPRFMLWFIPYMLVSILIHETAHMLALRFFGRRHDKVGFKFHYWILPAVYVRMNQSTLLAREEKIVVHAAGFWVNQIVNFTLVLLNVALIQSSDLAAALGFATLSLAYNALPVLNSDGYRVLLAVAGIDELKVRGRNPRWVRITKLLSWALVLSYGSYLTIDTYLGILNG